MNSVYIGLGSNLGDLRSNMESAVQEISQLRISNLKVSSLYENQALLPSGAPESWNQMFLNAVVSFDTDLGVNELWQELQKIEAQLGRVPQGVWSPRPIDLDILEFGGQLINSSQLSVPHPRTHSRNFVISPLKELNPGQYLAAYKKLEKPLPQWMKIINLTPDSFSHEKEMDLEAFTRELEQAREENTHIIDLGAESTRPGARALSPTEEWLRLEPFLKRASEFFKGDLLAPKISVDTYHPETAARSYELGVHIINDVSGLISPKMLSFLKNSDVDYILVHSLSVPADKEVHLKRELDPVKEILDWAQLKLKELKDSGVDLNRIIFDPGIGFGKTALQSHQLLQHLDEFKILPVRLLIGHSRKSFLNPISKNPFFQRDAESVGACLAMSKQAVDIYRVHNVGLHKSAFLAHSYVKS